MNKFNLMFIFKLAIKNAFLLLITGTVCAAAVYSYFKFIDDPKYSATGSLLVTNGGIFTDTSIDGNRSILNNTDLMTSINLVGTIDDILNTNGIYKRLSKEIDGKYSYKQLKTMVTIRRKSDKSIFINVSFTSADKTEAINLVNEFLILAPDYINEFVPNSEVAVATSDSSARVLPQTSSLMAMGAVSGMVLVLAILVLIQSANTVVKNEEDFTDRFDIEILASIPDFEKSKNDKYNSRYNYSYGYSNKGGGY